MIDKQCFKKGYTSRKIAKKARKYLNQKGRSLKYIYYCDTCESFHLTSQDKKKSRIKAKSIANKSNK